MTIDLLVAGGGPAGLGAAIEGARRGMRVAVVEPHAGVIDKACGEGLMPPAVALLREMDVAVDGHPFVGIRYVAGPHCAEARFRRGVGLGVRRTVLHAALLERARALGVAHVADHVAAVRQDAHRVWVTLAGGDVMEAPWLVAADGLHSPIRRQLGLEGRTPRSKRYGIRRHFRAAPWTDRVEVHWSARCEAYVTPVAADLVGVAILFTGHGSFDDLLTDFPALRAKLGDPCTRAAGAGPFAQRATRPRAGRVVLVGDAAGFLDPLTGEGVRLALAAARAAVDCLADHHPERYDAAWRSLFWRYRLLTGTLLWLQARPWLRPHMVPFLRGAPWLMEAGLRFLCG